MITLTYQILVLRLLLCILSKCIQASGVATYEEDSELETRCENFVTSLEERLNNQP